MNCSMPGFSVLHCLLEFAKVHSLPLSWWCHLTISSATPFSSCLQCLVHWLLALDGQSIGTSASESVLQIVRVDFLRIDWFNFLAVQGTLKSLLQYHKLKTILQNSPFFMVQLSHPYMTPVKSVALTVRTFVSKVVSMLCNTLFRSVIAFLPKSKRLLISWLLSPAAVSPRKENSSLFPLFPLLFAIKWWDWMPRS